MRKLSNIVMTVMVLVLISGCGGQKQAAQTSEEVKMKMVDVMKIKKQTEPLSMTLMGIVEPNQSAVLSFSSSGKITRLHVKNGEFVKEGQILGELDTTLSASESILAGKLMEEANASRNKLLQGSTKEAINQQQLKIESAKQNLAKAEKDLQIGESLLSSGAISKNEVDLLKNEVGQLTNILKAEEIALETLMKGPEQNQIASANLSIAQAQKESIRVSKDLEGKILKAPFNGIVIDLNQVEGDIANPGTPLLKIVDLSKVKVKLQVRKDIIDQFKVNNEVKITSQEKQKMPGIVSYMSPVADPASGKYVIEVTVPLGKMEWKEGTVIGVEIPQNLITGIVIPLQSVGINEKGNYVLLVNKGKVMKQQVELGQTVDSNVEILSGLTVGQNVIISGISYLLEGEKVEMKEVTSGQNH